MSLLISGNENLTISLLASHCSELGYTPSVNQLNQEKGHEMTMLGTRQRMGEGVTFPGHGGPYTKLKFYSLGKKAGGKLLDRHRAASPTESHRDEWVRRRSCMLLLSHQPKIRGLNSPGLETPYRE